MENNNIHVLEMGTLTFNVHKRECDGICSLCGCISWGGAEPMAVSRYCIECENKTVVGMEIALQSGLVKVTHALTH